MATTTRPGEALTRLREYLTDGFGFEPSSPIRTPEDTEIVTALALASIAESLHEIAGRA